MPGYEGGATAVNPVVNAPYLTQWGAIAIDDVAGRAGAVTGRATEAAAKREALDDCKAKGGSQCRISLAYDNECAAVAWMPGYRSSSSAPTVEEAKNDALSRCNRGSGSCQIVYSACSLPRRVD